MIAQDISRTFLLIVCACAVALAQDNGPPDPVTDFCYIRGSSLHNYNQQVYIYGGIMGWQPGFENYSGPKISDDYLSIIDVSKPFNKNHGFESYEKRISLPDKMPRLTVSTMWPIAKDTLASFLGWHEVSHYAVDHKVSAITNVYPVNSKFTLDTTTNSWTVGQVKSTTNFVLQNNLDGALLRIGSQMSAWVPSIRRGYYLGGFLSKDAANITWDDGSRGVPGGASNMIIYDAASDSLNNASIPFDNVDGQLVHLTTKDDEILINFGGSSTTIKTMTNFWIYSTKQNKWFSFRSLQNTNVPSIRKRFCAAVVSAPDNSSHQIFISGGDDDNAIIPFDDTVWVLSIPSFDWIKLPGIGNDLLTSAPDARREPVCLRVGKKFMMSWGGQLNDNGCYDYRQKLFLLDMTTGFWVNDFNPDDDYEVHQSVVKIIGGTTKGGAQKLKPDGGFRDPDLEKLMTFNIGPGNGQTSDASGKHAAANKSNTGAIAGGVVGGIAGLAIIGGAVFYFLRKQRYAALAEKGQSQTERSPGPVEAPAEASKQPGVRPNEGTYQTEYNPVYPAVEFPGDVRLDELEGVRSRNELPS
ncbi:hypothetical protein BZA77DRAFT_297187 [Pyronema omphalodes]|nr:hypothetical protein BZA77DRAFT_297187 [Pyronema omphalodes]